MRLHDEASVICRTVIVGQSEVNLDGTQFIECDGFLHADYVRSALENRFTARLTAQTTADDYSDRVLATAFVYAALGETRTHWYVFSFRIVTGANPEFVQAQAEASMTLQNPIFRYEIYRRSGAPALVSPNDFRRRLLPTTDQRIVFASPRTRSILQRRKTQATFSALPVNV